MNAVILDQPTRAISDQVDFTPTGLVIHGSITFQEWQSLGRALHTMYQRVHWWIGDWLMYGEAKWGEMYSQAMDATGFDYGTLANDKYVAGRFQFSPRSEKLSFSHHKAVASLPPAEAQALLERAEANHWTVQDLTEARRERYPDNPPPAYATARERQLVAIAQMLERWTEQRFRSTEAYQRIKQDLDRIMREIGGE